MPRNFPHWIKAYCDFTKDSEAPTDFHFWTGVSTIASVLKRRVWKDELHFKWTPNFYIIFVGPAGVVTKSTTLNIGYDLLRQVKDVAGAPVVKFGPDSMTWHGLGKKFESAVEYVQYKTPQGQDTKLLMSPLTCSVSELGTFLKPNDKDLVSFLTDVWDGKERPFEHATGYSGQIVIESPWLNVIGATTPEWMQDNFPPSMLQQGIGSRVIFVYGDAKRHLAAYPSRRPHAATYQPTREKLIADLAEIAKLVGPYDLTDDAYKWGEDWYARHHGARASHLASGRYGGYLARKQTHLHKLAMVLAAAQRDTLMIERDDLEVAEKILETTEHSMIKVFESVGVVDEAKHVAEVVAFVRTYKWITASSLYKLCWNVMSERDFKQALKIAIEGELLEIVTRGNERGVSPKQRTVN